MVFRMLITWLMLTNVRGLGGWAEEADERLRFGLTADAATRQPRLTTNAASTRVEQLFYERRASAGPARKS